MVIFIYFQEIAGNYLSFSSAGTKSTCDRACAILNIYSNLGFNIFTMMSMKNKSV